MTASLAESQMGRECRDGAAPNWDLDEESRISCQGPGVQGVREVNVDGGRQENVSA